MVKREGIGAAPVQLPAVPSCDPSGDPNAISQR